MLFMTKLCMLKPVSREFSGTVCHVLPAEHTELKHFLRSQFRTKFGIKVFSFILGKDILVPVLH